MKKIFGLIILILITFSISSCSSDDNSGNNNSAINPPDWIIGTWFGQVGETNSGLGFKFTSNDFCSIAGSQTSCFAEPVNQSQGIITVEEVVDSENYIITINNNNTVSNTFHFRKYSETEIEVVQSTGLNPRYVKQ